MGIILCEPIPALAVELADGFRAAGLAVISETDLANLNPEMSDTVVAYVDRPHVSAGLRVIEQAQHVLALHDTRSDVSPEGLLALGAHGVVPRGACSSDVLAALAAVTAGFVVTPQSAREPRTTPSRAQQLIQLTSDERRWLHLAAHGMSVAEIAQTEGHSQRTFYRRLQDLYRRIGTRGLAETVVLATLFGIVTAEIL